MTRCAVEDETGHCSRGGKLTRGMCQMHYQRWRRSGSPGPVAMLVGLGPSHGTSRMYELGCRCQECRTYQNARNARNRADRLASGRLNHGTRSAWDAGCRCDACLAVKRESDHRYYHGTPLLTGGAA